MSGIALVTVVVSVLKMDFRLLIVACLQCFDTVGWASGRASGL